MSKNDNGVRSKDLTQLRTLERGTFECDNGDVAGYHYPDFHFNGFAIPFFTLANAKKAISMLYADFHNLSVTVIPISLTIKMMAWCEFEEKQIVKYFPIGKDGLYCLGEYCWQVKKEGK